MGKLKPCPFCGGDAKVARDVTCGYETFWVHCLKCHSEANYGHTEAEAIKAWNTRAAMEFDNWFYLPKPKEPIVEVAETTNAWDGTKVRTDVFYQVQKQAIVNWAKELDENIIKRICEVWNTQPERTCHQVNVNGYGFRFECSACGYVAIVHNCEIRLDELPNYCPNCGAKVVDA